MSNKKTSRIGSAFAFLISGVFVIAALYIIFNKQQVLDQFSVWSYTPSSMIEEITSNADLTEKGKFIFYATKPSVENQEGFNQECPRQEAGSPILGCYTSDDRIYIYNLTNEQLDGMEEVTAAHEMLHAVWVRTSKEDQEKLSSQLKAAYESLADEELKERMEYYERTEPGEFYNELHSILGTETPGLGNELEEYYAQFFDRATVLALQEKYSAVYEQLNGRAEELYARMESLAASIEGRSQSYDTAAASLRQDVEAFNQRAQSGGFSTQSQFNRERAELVARSNELDRIRQAINGDIVTYNEYYSEYQDIAKQIEVLNSSIDSFKQIDQAPSV